MRLQKSINKKKENILYASGNLKYSLLYYERVFNTVPFKNQYFYQFRSFKNKIIDYIFKKLRF